MLQVKLEILRMPDRASRPCPGFPQMHVPVELLVFKCHFNYSFRFVLAAFSSSTACAAANREIGTRNGDALT